MAFDYLRYVMPRLWLNAYAVESSDGDPDVYTLLRDNRPLWQYSVAFMRGDCATDATIDGLILDRDCYDAAFISGTGHPVKAPIPHIQRKRSGGKYISGAKRTYTLPEPIISGVISVENGSIEDCRALEKAAEVDEVWILMAGLYVRRFFSNLSDDPNDYRPAPNAIEQYNNGVAALPFPFNAPIDAAGHRLFRGQRLSVSNAFGQGYDAELQFQHSAILTRDLTLTKRTNKTIDGGYSATLKYSGVWSAERGVQP